LKGRRTDPRGPKPIGPYSQAIKANGFVFVSGQIALDPQTGEFVGTDVRQQTERVMDNLKAILEASGVSLGHVVKTTVYLKDMNEFTAMNEVLRAYFTLSPPARSTVQAARLPKDALVEIDVIAFLESSAQFGVPKKKAITWVMAFFRFQLVLRATGDSGFPGLRKWQACNERGNSDCGNQEVVASRVKRRATHAPSPILFMRAGGLQDPVPLWVAGSSITRYAAPSVITSVHHQQ